MAGKFIDLKISSFEGVEYFDVQELKYRAAMNDSYAIVIQCLYSGNDVIRTENLIGENASITISDVDSLENKYLHGVITDVHQHNSMNLKASHAFKEVVLTIEPLFSLMGEHHNTRIFAPGNVLAYVKSIASDYRINKFEPPVDCQGLIQREFCIQYNETDLNFIKRLLESEGIFYYFRHDEHGDTLKLGSGIGDYCRDEPIKLGTGVDSIAYSSISRSNRIVTQIDKVNDYDFNNPRKSLMSANNKSFSKNVLNNSDIKNYAYPYPVRSFVDSNKNTSRNVGNNISRRRLNSQQSHNEVVKLHIPGIWKKFDIGKKIQIEGEAGFFVITEYSLTVSVDSKTGPIVFSKITAIDTTRSYCPPLETPIPRVPSQTAVVIGSEDKVVHNKATDDDVDNIFAKVKFHWDINPDHTSDNNECSCWIRVAQAWAGPRRGFVFPPRAGDEVFVIFESGHPDMPIIVGGAFNGSNAAPYSLKENKSVSGIISQTIGHGNKAGRSSAILFNDDEGKEEFSLLTKGQQVNIVGKDCLRQVDGSVTEHVKKDVNLTVDGNILKKVKGKYILEADEICFKSGDSFFQIKEGNLVLVGEKIIENSGNKSSDGKPEELAPQNPIV